MTELVFTGRNLGVDYLDFVADRATRFSLHGWAVEGEGGVRVVLRGPAELIDMLEIACLLGPADCLVDAVRSRPLPVVDVNHGFSLRLDG